MKNVLKIVLASFVIMFMSVNAFSQKPDKIARMVERDLAERVEVMGLSADQQAKCKVVLTEFYTNRVEAAKLTGDERKQSMKALRLKLEEGMSVACTPEQRALWNKNVQEKKNASKPKNK